MGNGAGKARMTLMQSPSGSMPNSTARVESASTKDPSSQPAPAAGQSSSGGTRVRPRGKVFRDPVHGLIRIDPRDEFILDLIDTPVFQRLRRVRQLGVSSLTYSGAEHSRFSHSMGVFNFAQRILETLRRRYASDRAVLGYLDGHERVAKAAALLHDIGHGPFSHLFERFPGITVDHERKTTELITSGAAEIGIADVLSRNRISPQEVAGVISKTSEHRLVVGIVSSQVDADRMDYLLRDSMMTGVQYGLFDSEWLLNAMCICREPGTAIETDPVKAPLGWRLALDESRGLRSAEQMICARLHMTQQVYMHRVTRGYEMLLLFIFALVKEKLNNPAVWSGVPSPVRFFFENLGKVPPTEWLAFDEAAMTSALQAWASLKEPELAQLARYARGYVWRERCLSAYRLASPGGGSMTAGMEVLASLGQLGLRRDVDWGLDDNKTLPYKGVIASANGRDSEERSALSVMLGSGNPLDVGVFAESRSEMLRAWDDKLERESRLFIDKQCEKKAEQALNQAGWNKEGES